VGETIIVADEIRITVVSIRGDRVRIGVAAPEDIRVDRLEIHERRSRIPEEVAYSHDRSEAIPLFD